MIRSSLPEAVEACIDAAGHEFDVLRQRTLLRAASYGQAFCRLVCFDSSGVDLLRTYLFQQMRKIRRVSLYFASSSVNVLFLCCYWDISVIFSRIGLMSYM